MPLLNITTKFYPIRVLAYMRNEAELNVSIENKGKDPYWIEADVIVPSSLSLAPDKELSSGRLRIGIVSEGEIRSSRCKIYAGAQTHPDTYNITVIGYAFNRDGVISTREETKAKLRCERMGQV